MLIVYSFKLCNKIKKFFLKKAISEKKNTLYICKAGTRGKEKNKSPKQDGK